MTRASEGELGALLGTVARHLADKLSSGEATASDVSNAIKLLKDNNITCTPGANTDLSALQERLNNQSARPDDADLATALEQAQFSGYAN
jgi:hypothetical protein